MITIIITSTTEVRKRPSSGNKKEKEKGRKPSSQNGNLVRKKIDREKRGCGDSLGRSGGFFFEPIANVFDVAPENGSRLFHVTPQEKNDGAHTRHCQHEIRQPHRFDSRSFQFALAALLWLWRSWLSLGWRRRHEDTGRLSPLDSYKGPTVLFFRPNMIDQKLYLTPLVRGEGHYSVISNSMYW